MVECEIPIDIFATKYTKDGAESKLYPIILGYKDKFTSLAACDEDHPEQASKVSVSGAQVRENPWIDASSGTVRTGYNISSNFINPVKDNFEPLATFELSGVVLDMIPETSADGEETGRLKVKLGVVGWQGRVDIVELIAESSGAVNFIQSNYNKGDTVNLNGRINMSKTTREWKEEQGFGEPIVRRKTEVRREFIILGGSPSGLEDDYSYDSNDIKVGLAARNKRIEEKAEAAKNKTPKKNVAKTGADFGF